MEMVIPDGTQPKKYLKTEPGVDCCPQSDIYYFRSKLLHSWSVIHYHLPQAASTPQAMDISRLPQWVDSVSEET